MRLAALLTLFRRCAARRLRLVAGLLLAVALCAVAAFDPVALQRQLSARFGAARAVLFKDWLQMIEVAKPLTDEAKLTRVNDFVNRTIGFADDLVVWQQEDYWATPLETIGQGRADCEDFAIIKYVSLRMAGVPSSKLRLIYVKAVLKAPGGVRRQAHMVLAYYATPNADPQVLDNLEAAIRPAADRPDLQPVFSFNSDGIFSGASGREKAAAGGLSRLSRWEDAVHRIRAEGYYDTAGDLI